MTQAEAWALLTALSRRFISACIGFGAKMPFDFSLSTGTADGGESEWRGKVSFFIILRFSSRSAYDAACNQTRSSACFCFAGDA